MEREGRGGSRGEEAGGRKKGEGERRWVQPQVEVAEEEKEKGKKER